MIIIIIMQYSHLTYLIKLRLKMMKLIKMSLNYRNCNMNDLVIKLIPQVESFQVPLTLLESSLTVNVVDKYFDELFLSLAPCRWHIISSQILCTYFFIGNSLLKCSLLQPRSYTLFDTLMLLQLLLLELVRKNNKFFCL